VTGSNALAAFDLTFGFFFFLGISILLLHIAFFNSYLSPPDGGKRLNKLENSTTSIIVIYCDLNLYGIGHIRFHTTNIKQPGIIKDV